MNHQTHLCFTYWRSRSPSHVRLSTANLLAAFGTCQLGTIAISPSSLICHWRSLSLSSTFPQSLIHIDEVRPSFEVASFRNVLSTLLSSSIVESSSQAFQLRHFLTWNVKWSETVKIRCNCHWIRFNSDSNSFGFNEFSRFWFQPLRSTIRVNFTNPTQFTSVI